MKWFNNLNKKQKEILSGVLVIIGVVFVIIGIIVNYLFLVPAIVFPAFGVYVSHLAKKQKNDSENTDDNKSIDIRTLQSSTMKTISNIETSKNIITEYERNTYKSLISNKFELTDNTTNFECSLMVMALNQIVENKCYNPADLSFNINDKMNELSEYGKAKFLKSKFKSFISVDIETTGLSYETDKIIQISAVKVIDGVITETYEKYVNPKKHISKNASEINGIYDEDVKGAETIDIILPEFIDFIGKSAIVMHNEKFDLSFLKQASVQIYGENRIKNKHFCTMKLWKSLYKEIQNEEAPSAKLSTLVVNLLSKDEISEYYANQHTATCDAVATAKVFMKMYSD